MGLVEFIYPVFIGSKSSTAVDSLENFDWSCFGAGGMPDVSVKSVEDKLREHLERLSLGDPLSPHHTVKETVSKILANQGRKVEGDIVQGLDAVAAAVVGLCSTVIDKSVVANSTEISAASTLPERKMSTSATSVISDSSQAQGGVSRARNNLMQSVEDDKVCQASTITMLEELCMSKKAESLSWEEELKKRIVQMENREVETLRREEELIKRLCVVEEKLRNELESKSLCK